MVPEEEVAAMIIILVLEVQVDLLLNHSAEQAKVGGVVDLMEELMGHKFRRQEEVELKVQE